MIGIAPSKHRINILYKILLSSVARGRAGNMVGQSIWLVSVFHLTCRLFLFQGKEKIFIGSDHSIEELSKKYKITVRG